MDIFIEIYSYSPKTYATKTQTLEKTVNKSTKDFKRELS